MGKESGSDEFLGVFFSFDGEETGKTCFVCRLPVLKPMTSCCFEVTFASGPLMIMIIRLRGLTLTVNRRGEPRAGRETTG